MHSFDRFVKVLDKQGCVALYTPDTHNSKTRNPAYPEHVTTLGDHIRKRRLDLGLHQKDIAVVVNATTPTITNWEKNRCDPALRVIPKIIKFLGYNPQESKVATLGENSRRLATNSEEIGDLG